MIETEFLGKKLKSPTRLASGILGVNAGQLIRVAEAGAGAVTMKSIGPREREGHKNPCVVEWEHGIMNAVGLPTPGIKNMDAEFEELKELEKLGVPLIASVYGGTMKEFAEVTEYVAQKKPFAIEANISCPNSEQHGMVFGCNPETAGKVISIVKEKAGKIPVIAKLTPAATSPVAVGKACEEAGADALCAANTMPGMIIDAEARKPILSFRKGGMSGPALKPINLKITYELFENVQVPIIGEGGISSGKDAIEYILAGASICGIGSAVYRHGPEAFSLISKEIEEWMKKENVKSIKEIRGAAHV